VQAHGPATGRSRRRCPGLPSCASEWRRRVSGLSSPGLATSSFEDQLREAREAELPSRRYESGASLRGESAHNNKLRIRIRAALMASAMRMSWDVVRGRRKGGPRLTAAGTQSPAASGGQADRAIVARHPEAVLDDATRPAGAHRYCPMQLRPGQGWPYGGPIPICPSRMPGRRPGTGGPKWPRGIRRRHSDSRPPGGRAA
jgi:hypothetical protein